MEKNKIEVIPERLDEIFFEIENNDDCSNCPLYAQNVACCRNWGIRRAKTCTELLFDYVQGKELPKAWKEDNED